MKMRKKVGALAVAAGLVGGGVGAAVLNSATAGAQSNGSTSTTAPAPTGPGAIDPAAARQARLATELQSLVDNGTITSAQRDAVVKTLAEAPGFGRGGGHGPGMRGGMAGEDGDVVAKAIGIDSATLRSEMEAGKTIAQVAQAHNVGVDAVVKALVDAESAEIDQRVTDGLMTADEAAQAKAGVTQRVTDLVNGVWGFGGRHGAWHHEEETPSSTDASTATN